MKTYWRILSYARPFRRFVGPYFITSLLASLFGLLNLTLIQPLLNVLFDEKQRVVVSSRPVPRFDVSYFTDLFNYYFTQVATTYGKFGALQFVCATIIISVFFANVFRYFSVRIIETFKAHTVAQLRQAVFDNAVGLSLSFFSNERKGDLISRITTDVQEVEGSVGRGFSALFKELFLLIFMFITLFLFSFKLTLFTLVIIPLSGALIGGLAKKLKESATEVQQRLSNIISLLDETFGGIRVVKGFNAEHFIRARFIAENQGYRNSVLKMLFRQEIAPPFSEFMGISVVAGILLYGGSMVLSEQSDLTAADFVTYIVIFSQVLRPAKEISNAVGGIQRGIASGERILQLIDTPLTVTDAPNSLVIKDFNKEIEVKNVCFEYESGTPVLQDICFKIQKGQTVALVGSSGGGKSTIADLIPRFYDPTQGQILIDGNDLRAVTTTSLRNLMGIVTQESILFNDSIFNNIAFGSNATEAQVVAAAQIANAHDFILEQPEGYQTTIGDRGTKLSGGQRQRISIARAILKNPPILILDEATSALDTESEKLVQDALTNLMKNRTTLVIAHRLSTIQHADQILVINNGQIVEHGTHDELLKRNDGFYRKLSLLQLS
ncbi:MAG: ABC transporter ATP-binding protein [Runella slithyformis]|nr:MAG: ABC transporter ATP-binding protein [Runella slithyformis]TAF29581.1 MAG: ABC transporter ATP-binding protein [Runella slithyformis]TAF48415.1 MAG: ABC transporter ATP-binding protein [Runella slithyformis]TAF83026.1 MAG: ABC transporter ATP-binding protein [Runella slithyformis]